MPMDPTYPLIRKRNQLAQQVDQAAAALDARARRLANDEMRVRQGLGPNRSENDIKQNLNTFLPPWLQPGNLGDLNRILWPFYFTFTAPELIPNSNGTGVFTVTQEAAFVWMSMTRAVFTKDEDGLVTYVDPNQPGQSGTVQNLSFSLKDAQSTRFFTQIPITLDCVGHPEFPTTLPSPLLFLPNSAVEMSFFNSDPDLTYIPFVTFFGYRVRIDEAQNILSTLQG